MLPWLQVWNSLWSVKFSRARKRRRCKSDIPKTPFFKFRIYKVQKRDPRTAWCAHRSVRVLRYFTFFIGAGAVPHCGNCAWIPGTKFKRTRIQRNSKLSLVSSFSMAFTISVFLIIGIISNMIKICFLLLK